jgi:hypothetical protein
MERRRGKGIISQGRPMEEKKKVTFTTYKVKAAASAHPLQMEAY